MTKKTIPLHQLAVDTVGVEVYRIAYPGHLLHRRAEAMIPHRHDHYSCFLVEHGRIEMLVDFQPVQLAAATLLVSHPGQIHQLGPAQDFQGWVLLADAKLFPAHLRSAIEQSRTGVSLLHLEASEQHWFQHLFSALSTSALPQSPLLVRTEVLPALLNAFLGQAAALLQTQAQQQAPARQLRGIGLTKHFRQLLQRDFLTCKKPAEYAAKLNLTVSYLNDTVKAVTGFPVSYFIQQEVLAEAQRLLFYTELSIKEIADHLGYEDPKYFIRFFGKGQGMSPSLFRKNALAGKHLPQGARPSQ